MGLEGRKKNTHRELFSDVQSSITNPRAGRSIQFHWRIGARLKPRNFGSQFVEFSRSNVPLAVVQVIPECLIYLVVSFPVVYTKKRSINDPTVQKSTITTTRWWFAKSKWRSKRRFHKSASARFLGDVNQMASFSTFGGSILNPSFPLYFSFLGQKWHELIYLKDEKLESGTISILLRFVGNTGAETYTK